MTVRPPRNLPNALTPETGWNVLEYELLQQKAHTLGTLGASVERALAALRAFEAGEQAGRAQERSDLLDEAAERVWAFMIQRELCGLRQWESVVRDYRIPREVLNRVGRVRSKTG